MYFTYAITTTKDSIKAGSMPTFNSHYHSSCDIYAKSFIQDPVWSIHEVPKKHTHHHTK